MKQNSHIYAWIYIPGTVVDYPVLQHPTDAFYYLEHNPDGTEGFPGSIYTEYFNTTTFQDRGTVIYGHSMKDGSMFHTLHNFESPDFFNQYQYVYIYLPSGEVLVYQVFASLVYSDVHIMAQYQFTEDAHVLEYVADLENARSMSANFRNEIQISEKNHILVLSTCVGVNQRTRYLVNAVLVNDPAMDREQQLSVLGVAS
ncbi:MAG: class B sortase [Lachnospiraceae bacterium]|nr:class B sortase [Lachnospiraceae bacterium]